MQIGYVAEEDYKNYWIQTFFIHKAYQQIWFTGKICAKIDFFSLKMYIFIFSYLPFRMLISTV